MNVVSSVDTFEPKIVRLTEPAKIVDQAFGIRPAPDALALTFFDELAEAGPKPWLIKNVIARGETSSWIAPPGTGKSALLTDVAVSASGGRNDWRGYRCKGRCGVLYLALERADLVKRRLIAHRRRDGLPSLPIAVSSQVIDLMHAGCVNVILNAIDRVEQHYGCELGLVVIDTYPKGIAAGGGDESLARDQNIALANLRRVLDQKQVHIAGIGHTGKDESRGERGSNARLGDVDLLVQISGDNIKTATVKKANDQAGGPLTSFQLEPFDFGADEDGDPIRTFILSQDVPAAVTADRALSDQQRLALDAMIEALLSQGRDAPPDYQLPRETKVVSAEKWKEELYRRNILDKEASNPRARFNELRTRLAGKRLIGTRDDVVWIATNEKRQ
jgi:AAA domain-containing protein